LIEALMQKPNNKLKTGREKENLKWFFFSLSVLTFKRGF